MRSALQKQSFQRSLLAAVLSAVVFSVSGAASAAILNAQYSVHVAPSERVLAAIGTAEFDQVLLEESCDNPHLRVRARNKPAVMITNDGISDAPIESFTITINEGPYMFGDGDSEADNFMGFVRESIFYTDSGVSITGSSVSADGTELTINFDGLTAGRSVIFAIDLDANDPDMFPFPDYRTVLYGAPQNSIADPTAPGSFSATFADADETRTLSSQFGQQADPLIYFNGNIRPYHTMDMIEVNEFGQTEIPEPGACVLAALACGGLLTISRRRKS